MVRVTQIQMALWILLISEVSTVSAHWDYWLSLTVILDKFEEGLDKLTLDDQSEMAKDGRFVYSKGFVYHLAYLNTLCWVQ